MSARDDYPAVATLHDAWEGSGLKCPESVRMFIEIERLRANIDEANSQWADAIAQRDTARHRLEVLAASPLHWKDDND